MATETRARLREELRSLESSTLGALDLVVASLDRALDALARQDVELAVHVVHDDDRIDGRYLEVHQGILSLLALQSPVATDLRLVAALLHTIKHAERMGDQVANVAKLIPLSGHAPPVNVGLLDTVERMGGLARTQVIGAKHAFARRDVGLARDLVRQDDTIDRLNRDCFAMALEVGGQDPESREWAMYMMLVARALERLADHAVDVGEQTAFVVTGLFEEFQGRAG